MSLKMLWTSSQKPLVISAAPCWHAWTATLAALLCPLAIATLCVFETSLSSSKWSKSCLQKNGCQLHLSASIEFMQLHPLGAVLQHTVNFFQPMRGANSFKSIVKLTMYWILPICVLAGDFMMVCMRRGAEPRWCYITIVEGVRLGGLARRILECIFDSLLSVSKMSYRSCYHGQSNTQRNAISTCTRVTPQRTGVRMSSPPFQHAFALRSSRLASDCSLGDWPRPLLEQTIFTVWWHRSVGAFDKGRIEQKNQPGINLSYLPETDDTEKRDRARAVCFELSCNKEACTPKTCKSSTPQRMFHGIFRFVMSKN